MQNESWVLKQRFTILLLSRVLAPFLPFSLFIDGLYNKSSFSYPLPHLLRDHMSTHESLRPITITSGMRLEVGVSLLGKMAKWSPHILGALWKQERNPLLSREGKRSHLQSFEAFGARSGTFQLNQYPPLLLSITNLLFWFLGRASITWPFLVCQMRESENWHLNQDA